MKLAISFGLLAFAGALGCGRVDAVGAAPDGPPTQVSARDAAVDGASDADLDLGRGDSYPNTGWDAATTSAPAGDTPCQEVTANHQASAPDMLIVLDRSGSMVGFGTELGVDRWGPSLGAVASITGQLQDLIAFGLSMFAAPDASGFDLFSCATGTLDVPLMTGSAGAIAQAMQRATPLGGATPTGATLEAAARVFGDRTPKPGAKVTPAYVLLVTDGEPTCEPEPLDTTPASVARANTAIERLAASGVKTYVIGYSVSGATDTMNGFAQRGGTGHFYPVESGEQLIAEFRRITGDVITCAYELERAPRDAHRMLVKIDGVQLNLDPADGNGWTLQGTTVKLIGSPCGALKNGDPHQVQIKEVCEDVVPIL